MIWGYAGVFPGAFKVWDGDTTMNKLNFAVDNGFESCSMGFGELRDPARCDEVGRFIADHGLKVSAHPHVRWMDPDLDEVRRQIDRFYEDMRAYRDVLNAPIITTGAGRVHRFMDDPTLEEQLDRLAEVFTPVAQFCHEMDCPFGIENHGDYYCSDLVELCQRVPHMGIFLDTGNTYLIGEKSIPACREAAPYTIGTHFKDHRVHPQPRGLTFVIKGAPLGEGHVGLEQVYKDLLELNPDPDRLVMQWEMIPPKDMDPYECLERSWQFIRRITEQYGTGKRES